MIYCISGPNVQSKYFEEAPLDRMLWYELKIKVCVSKYRLVFHPSFEDDK